MDDLATAIRFGCTTLPDVAAQEHAKLSPGTILVVEDEPDVARPLARCVQAAGLRLRTATSVHEAYHALTERIDGLIVDLGLPDGDGFDVVVEARRVEPDVPVLVLTGHRDEVSINIANRLTVEFAVKPSGLDLVPAFVDRCKTSPRKTLADLIADLLASHNLTAHHGRILHVGVTQSATRAVMARELGVSQETVKTRVHEILDRLDADSIEDVVVPLRVAVMRKRPT